MIGHILTNVISRWLQNGTIPSVVARRLVMLIKKVSGKWNVISNLWPETLLNSELQILAKVPPNTLAHVMCRLVVCSRGDKEMCISRQEPYTTISILYSTT